MVARRRRLSVVCFLLYICVCGSLVFVRCVLLLYVVVDGCLSLFFVCCCYYVFVVACLLLLDVGVVVVAVL